MSNWIARTAAASRNPRNRSGEWPLFASYDDRIELITLNSIASAPPEHFQELVAEATALRGQLLSDATALASRGFVSAAKLEDLKGPVGYKNIASDVLTMTNMIRGNWANVAARTGVSEAELDRAEIVGDQLVNDIGVRDQSPATVAAVTLERQQAYTLMVKAYDQVRRAVTYLHHHCLAANAGGTAQKWWICRQRLHQRHRQRLPPPTQQPQLELRQLPPLAEQSGWRNDARRPPLAGGLLFVRPVLFPNC